MPLKIVVLTGAGISAESGLATFRGPGGLWNGLRAEDLATPEAFARDPVTVLRWYDERRAKARAAQPNAAHVALARLAQTHQVTLVTQNVDSLHERAGSPEVIHMHGSHEWVRCADCGHRIAAPVTLSPRDPCPACAAHRLRPDIVWFGEMPMGMDRVAEALADCEVFAAIGTSGHVHPAAGFARVAARHGAHCVQMNLELGINTGDFHETRQGPATQVVPDWVEGLV